MSLCLGCRPASTDLVTGAWQTFKRRLRGSNKPLTPPTRVLARWLRWRLRPPNPASTGPVAVGSPGAWSSSGDGGKKETRGAIIARRRYRRMPAEGAILEGHRRSVRRDLRARTSDCDPLGARDSKSTATRYSPARRLHSSETDLQQVPRIMEARAGSERDRRTRHP